MNNTQAPRALRAYDYKYCFSVAQDVQSFLDEHCISSRAKAYHRLGDENEIRVEFYCTSTKRGTAAVIDMLAEIADLMPNIVNPHKGRMELIDSYWGRDRRSMLYIFELD